jgi:hypothetical protein
MMRMRIRMKKGMTIMVMTRVRINYCIGNESLNVVGQ